MAFAVIPISSDQTDESGVIRTCNRTFLNATASGNTQIVAAQGAGLRIRLLAANVTSGTALTIKFQSATTDICSGKPVAANGGWIAPYAPVGWFQTTANEALNVNLSGAGTVGVDIIWIQAG